jgi:cytochrome c2
MLLYRGALAGKGGKWNDKTLDKWLKSPADYAPGKSNIQNFKL